MRKFSKRPGVLKLNTILLNKEKTLHFLCDSLQKITSSFNVNFLGSLSLSISQFSLSHSDDSLLVILNY